MNSANTEFLQVWGQVKEWPVELRQDLADEIAKSVDADLPAANGPWTESKNSRRCELIDQDIQRGLSALERRELAWLEREMRVHRRRIAPLSMAGATRLHERLLAKKQSHDELLGGGNE